MLAEILLCYTEVWPMADEGQIDVTKIRACIWSLNLRLDVLKRSRWKITTVSGQFWLSDRLLPATLVDRLQHSGSPKTHTLGLEVHSSECHLLSVPLKIDAHLHIICSFIQRGASCKHICDKSTLIFVFVFNCSQSSWAAGPQVKDT